MTPERYQQISELYHAALELAPERRVTFLEQACDGDEALRREVESLIANDEQAGDFMETPALEVAAGLLAGHQAGSLIGESLGPYKIQALLGRGGMGEVYLAQDSRLGRRVALKLLPDHFVKNEERLGRFRQEARAASALNHPNILIIHEIGESETRHYIITEFIEGETLRASLMRRRRMKLIDALEVATQAASALAAAHAAGIVHRDIKPENIMLRLDGFVKILDFGLAKLMEKPGPQGASGPAASVGPQFETNPGRVMGTVSYMSPEQAQGLKVDGRSDIWSLGVVLYELLTGHAPFEGTTPNHVIVSILENEPPPLAHYAPEVPAELERVVKRMLRKSPEQRYQTTDDLLLDLRGLKRKLDSGVIPTGAGENVKARPTTLSVEPLVKRIKQPSRGALIALAALLVLALANIAYFTRSAKPAIDSLAILPFANVGADPDTEHLSDGITESLINNLSQIPQLRVMARSTVFSFKGRETDPRKIGSDLGVDAVVTGKVSQLGDTLIIQVELVDVTSGAQLWGEQFNRRLSDVLGVQEEIAQAISLRLPVRMTAHERSRVSKRHTESVEAYHAYLKGRHHWNKRTGESLKKSIEYFNQALETDPAYALAYAGLADSYNMLGRISFLAPGESYPRARAAAERALEIDETLAEAHTSRAIVKMDYEWDLVSAEEGFKRAISLNPGYPVAHQWYGLLLGARGQMDEGIREMKRAQELDPLSLIIDLGVGGLYIYARRYDEAIAHFQKTGELHPDAFQPSLNLAYIYEIKGMHDEAVTAYLKSRTLSGDRPEKIAALREVYATSGWRGYLRKRLEDMEAQSARQYVSPFSAALICVQLGEKDRAFTWLEKAYEERNFRLLYIGVDPRLDSLRSDPRFSDLLRRLGRTPSISHINATFLPQRIFQEDDASQPSSATALD